MELPPLSCPEFALRATGPRNHPALCISTPAARPQRPVRMESKRPAEEGTDDGSVKVPRAGSKWDVGTTGAEGSGRAGSKWDQGPGADGSIADSTVAAAATVVRGAGGAPPVPPGGDPSEKLASIEALLASNPSLLDGPVLPTGQLTDFEAVDVSIKFSCHTDVICALLSHDGSTLNIIRETSKCRIRLLPPQPTEPHMRCIHLGGSSEEVIAACQMSG